MASLHIRDVVLGGDEERLELLLHLGKDRAALINNE